MSEVYLILTAVGILASLLYAFQRTGDPLSPLVTFAPMLLYVYVYHPFVLQSSGELAQFFPRRSDVEFVLLLNLICILGFCLGANRFHVASLNDNRFLILGDDISPRVRKRFFNLAIILATMASVSFWYLVSISGGAVRMFNKPKPFFVSASGYLGEMPMLTFPALLLLAAAWQGRRLTFGRAIVGFLVASPQISWAIIGKRRGTVFMVVAALAAFWFLIKNKKPNWKMMIGGVGVLGLLLLFIAANRSRGMLSDSLLNAKPWLNQTLSGDNVTPGDEFVSGAALILVCDYYNHHYWGRRLFAICFIRPIPSAIWESKWEDLGLPDLKTDAGMCGLSFPQWQQAIGFNPPGGTAGGFVADAFIEWSWGAVVFCYLLGFLFSWLWKQWVTYGGVWTAIYVEAMVLSVFLPSQSVGAWAYRFLLLAVPTALVFRLVIPKKSRIGVNRVSTSTVRMPLPPRPF